MKIKMVKMGMDIDETRNHRIRGIIPTDDGKFIFVEVLQGTRPDRRYTSLTQKQYDEKYPNEEYIWVDGCFRVDIPEDYYKNYTKEYSEFDRHGFYDYPYTQESIVKFLKQFNKNITDIELTNEYYLDKFCEERGFFKLYDDRLKHSYEPKEIKMTDFKENGICLVNVLYTCYSASGKIYQEERVYKLKNKELISEYGKEKISDLLDKYIDKLYEINCDENFKDEYLKQKNELLESIENDENNYAKKEDTIDIDY